MCQSVGADSGNCNALKQQPKPTQRNDSARQWTWNGKVRNPATKSVVLSDQRGNHN
jgi:hypothetical protein